ncbi:MAG: DUF5717 family protein, partial [Lachnospiraceae bacterium]|nr:DUF5717 family protein [Lachnospiraceae bacterium]
MKEKIDRLSKGLFEYEMPQLVLYENSLDIRIEEGTVKTGSFIVSNSAKVRMKGVIYSTGKLVTLHMDKFVGTECEITYSVNAKGMEYGESHTGYIYIISDCGEYSIPFSITAIQAKCDSSIGPIRDLFHFANLAKTNWNEAVALFSSNTFPSVLIKNDKKNLVAYMQLLDSPVKDVALEEFLVLIHKKKRASFYTTQNSIDITPEIGSFREKITVTKDTWGYLEISLRTDAPFVSFSKDRITSEDFVNGTAQVDVIFNISDKMTGDHYAGIYLESPFKTIEIPVVCRCKAAFEDRRIRMLNLKKYEVKLVEIYISFRCGKINNVTFITEAQKLCESILLLIDRYTADYIVEQKQLNYLEEERTKYELFKCYIGIVGGRFKDDTQTYAMLVAKKAVFEKTNPTFYGTVLYLEAL